jgi:predicted Fe-Mo cluster-binding NifX family protein
MRTCIPVVDDGGLDSRLSPQFGTAPMFLIVDTDGVAWTSHVVRNVTRPQGTTGCARQDIVADEEIDAVIVAGIGPGALDKLRAAQVRVYHTARSTARAALQGIGTGALAPILGDGTGAGTHPRCGHGADSAGGEGCKGACHADHDGYRCVSAMGA